MPIIIPDLPKTLPPSEEELLQEINEAKDEYIRSAAETKMLELRTSHLNGYKSGAMRFLIDSFSGKTVHQMGQILARAERQEYPAPNWKESKKIVFRSYASVHKDLQESKEALRVSAAATEEARLRLIYAEDALAQHMRRMQEKSCLPTDHAARFRQRNASTCC